VRLEFEVHQEVPDRSAQLELQVRLVLSARQELPVLQVPQVFKVRQVQQDLPDLLVLQASLELVEFKEHLVQPEAPAL